ncbi:MAG: hypothetical protein LBB84_12910 [Tannerellaceae bacterium]|jgi:hypothetical protein|nr:hypothetical protein [Tannerellaceae bacterium]
MKAIHMKTNFLAVALLLLWNTAAGWADELDVSKKKEINQSFPVSLTDRLKVENKYGDVTITHWTKNEVDIRVVVEAKANTEAKAQQVLENIQIELRKSDNTVYGITSIRNNIGSGRQSYTIHYFISMPSKLPIDLSVRYGGINLPENNEGKANLELKYGTLSAGNFTQSVIIDAEYSKLSLGNAESLTMDLKYCGSVVAGNIRTLSLDSQYSGIKLRDADQLRIDNAYGGITIEKVNRISAETKYGNIQIGYVNEELQIGTLAYSTLTVDKLNANFKSVHVEATHSTLKLSISPQAAFRITAEGMKYGNVDIKGLKITESQTEEKSDRFYRINGGGEKQIYFNGNNYSSLKINAL